MTDTSDFDEGVQILMDQYPNIRLLNLTAGADGSYSYYQGKRYLHHRICWEGQ